MMVVVGGQGYFLLLDVTYVFHNVLYYILKIKMSEIKYYAELNETMKWNEWNKIENTLALSFSIYS